jgi:hypothetical protein
MDDQRFFRRMVKLLLWMGKDVNERDELEALDVMKTAETYMRDEIGFESSEDIALRFATYALDVIGDAKGYNYLEQQNTYTNCSPTWKRCTNSNPFQPQLTA